METLGLNVFITAVGLAAGPHAVEAMESSGLQLLGAGVVVTVIPHLVILLVGHYFFKMNTGRIDGGQRGRAERPPQPFKPSTMKRRVLSIAWLYHSLRAQQRDFDGVWSPGGCACPVSAMKHVKTCPARGKGLTSGRWVPVVFLAL